METEQETEQQLEAQDQEPEVIDFDDIEDDETGNNPVTAKVRREAQNLRKRLKTSEALNQTISARLEAYEKNEVENLAKSHLHSPSDLWLIHSLDDLERNEDGTLNRESLVSLFEKVSADRPTWIKNPPDLDQGYRGPVNSGQAPSWSTALHR